MAQVVTRCMFFHCSLDLIYISLFSFLNLMLFSYVSSYMILRLYFSTRYVRGSFLGDINVRISVPILKTINLKAVSYIWCWSMIFMLTVAALFQNTCIRWFSRSDTRIVPSDITATPSSPLN